MSYFGSVAKSCFGFLRSLGLAVSAPGMKEELARRDKARGGHGLQWLTPEEAECAEALARVIVPSDEETPGLAEIDVFGPPAAVALDGLISASGYLRYLYARGLFSFDLWARKTHECKFAAMKKEDQVAMFAAAQQIAESLAAGGSKWANVSKKIRATIMAGNGSFFAAKLYPQIRSDCLQIFYTSRVSWTWLGYDGPPMDKGYPSVVEPR